MSLDASLTIEEPVATVEDFFALLKPRVMSLVVFTGLAGIVAASSFGDIHPLTAFTALLCIAVGAGASGALNMAYDSDIDAVMARTATRPIPMGRIARNDALTFGWMLSVFSVALMGLYVNMLSGALLAFTIFFYVVVYTLGLKRRTPQNIVIGGLSGAMPAAIGWAAVTNRVELAPLLLVAIVFMWTPPHFWALALFRNSDYERAGIPMMPVVRGKPHTRLQILAYSLLLVPLGLAPAFVGLGGVLYLASAAIGGGVFLWEAVAVYRETDDAKEPAARRLFTVSLFYLFAIFASLIIEPLAGLPPLGNWM